jgi:sortase A
VKTLRVLVVLVLGIGGCLTARAAYLHAKAELAGLLIRRAWAQSLERGGTHAPWPRADMHPVARLSIPRLHYDEIVLGNATPRTLAFGPARLLSGADFGEPGNLVLAGHRTSWFEPLKGIATADQIEVEWIDGRRGGGRKRVYTVSEIQVMAPEDVRLLAQTPNETLTLITCYPFGRSPRSPYRFVVRALPAGPSQPPRSDKGA